MAVRNVTPHITTVWKGLNSFISRNNADEQTWIESDNVLVNARGEAEALRSPKQFGGAIPEGSGTNPQTVSDMDEFKRSSGNALVIFHGQDYATLTSDAGTPSIVPSPGFSPTSWTSLSINNTFQRINGSLFMQLLDDLTTWFVNGIPGPDTAPVISYVANGAATGTVTTSLRASYAFMNFQTGHVSQPSPLSNVLGATGAGFDLRIETFDTPITNGTDRIVFFLTLDGGTVPYLLVDASGDPIIINLAATTTDFDIATLHWDTLTPETIYNGAPLTTGTFMFGWKDRIFLVVDGGLQYSGFESCYIGNPWESWPVLNQLNLPNRTDRVVGGISTQSGALIFGKEDSYLLTGYPSDKVVSPQNLIAVTEHIDPLNWGFGIKDPKTAMNTPFGTIWVDQTKRIRLWNQQGVPSEIAQPLRTELDAMTGTMKARWFQHGKNGGYYVLSDGTTVLFIMVYLSVNNGQMQFGYGKSTSINPEAMAVVTFDNVERFVFAKNDELWEILSPAVEGDGWAVGTEIFFKVLIGARPGMNFSTLHSVQVNGSLEDLVITHAPYSETYPEPIELTEDLESDTGSSQYGIADSEERRYHILKFDWGKDDRFYRNITTLAVNVRDSGRLI